MGLKQQLKTLSPYNMVIADGVEESVSSLDTNSTRSYLDSGHSRLSNLSELSFDLKGLSRWGATTDPGASYGFRTSVKSAVVVSPRQAPGRSVSEASRSPIGALHNNISVVRRIIRSNSIDGSADVTVDRWGSGSSRDSSVRMPSQGLVAPKKPKCPQRKREQLKDLPEEDERTEEESSSSADLSNKRATRRSSAAGREQFKMPIDDVGQRSERTALNQLSVTADCQQAETSDPRRRRGGRKVAEVDSSMHTERSRRRGRKAAEVDSSIHTESSRSSSRRGSRRRNRDASQKRLVSRKSGEKLSSSRRSSSLGRRSQHDRPRQPRPVRRISGDGDP